MKPIALLSMLTLGSCAAASAVSPYEAAAVHAHVIALRSDNAPAPSPLPSSKCDGSGYITHGDGHRTPCPGCDNCKKKSIIKPAVLTLVSRQCADGSCAAPAAPAKPAGGGCSSGSCGSAGEARGPIRKVFKAKPVRRFLGRLFRRR